MHKSYLVLGLGVTGLAVARYLERENLNFSLADTRLNPPGLAEAQASWPNVAVHLGPLNTSLTCAASCIVLSPGISLAEPALVAAAQAGVEIIGDIELFARHVKTLNKPLVAITGSNAKSTVTSLLGAMVNSSGLKLGMAGNIGIPALDLLAAPSADVYVLELSSFQLETTSNLQAKAACFLNFSDDHLDRYPSREAYKQAKLRIFQQCQTAVFNRADTATWPSADLAATAISFGLSQPKNTQEFGVALLEKEHLETENLETESLETKNIEKDSLENKKLETESWLLQGAEALMPAAEIKLAGQHGVLNVLAAMALGKVLGLPLAAMRRAAQEFTGLPHRCQLIAQRQGVSFYNDSKATNVGATLAALAGLAQQNSKIWLLLGGQAKEQDFSPLTAALAQGIAGVALFGADAALIAEFLPADLPVLHAANLEEATLWAAQQAQAGEVVLLSPACASLDMFSSFEHRGEVFSQCVNQLPS